MRRDMAVQSLISPTGSKRSTLANLPRRFLVPLLASAMLVVVDTPAHANLVGSGNHKWAVVLCNFKDERATPNTASYYEHFFSDPGGGELGLLDYWRNVSFNQLSISGTTVTPTWNIAKDPAGAHPQLTRGQWINLPGSRLAKIQACAEGSGVNFTGYWGVTAIFPEARPHCGPPSTRRRPPSTSRHSRTSRMGRHRFS